MGVSRRNFLKLTGLGFGTATIAELGFDLSRAEAQVENYRIEYAKATPTICPYCACGCGLLVHTKHGKVINTEGDPDHPINEGAVCSKGATVYQIHDNERRLTKPLYRAPGSNKWEEKDWGWMLEKIAQNIKKTRDNSFIHQERNLTVNRTEAIGVMGSAAIDNEECYLLQKLARSLGIVYIEHQARI